jgi:broad specificity phosphatase PhoE
MTAAILLIRHAAHTHLGEVLSGRAGDVPLSQAGREQAQELARRLGGERLGAVHASPVRRARETAEAVAAVHGLPVTIAEPLNEIDFGDWTGKRFAELAGEADWERWNSARAASAPPGGEAMAAVQIRALAHLRRVADRTSGLVVAMVSHADVIRAAVCGVLGLSLDRLLAFDIDPASVTRIEAGPWGERLVSLNGRGL